MLILVIVLLNDVLECIFDGAKLAKAHPYEVSLIEELRFICRFVGSLLVPVLFGTVQQFHDSIVACMRLKIFYALHGYIKVIFNQVEFVEDTSVEITLLATAEIEKISVTLGGFTR